MNLASYALIVTRRSWKEINEHAFGKTAAAAAHLTERGCPINRNTNYKPSPAVCLQEHILFLTGAVWMCTLCLWGVRGVRSCHFGVQEKIQLHSVQSWRCRWVRQVTCPHHHWHHSQLSGFSLEVLLPLPCGKEPTAWVGSAFILFKWDKFCNLCDLKSWTEAWHTALNRQGWEMSFSLCFVNSLYLMESYLQQGHVPNTPKVTENFPLTSLNLWDPKEYCSSKKPALYNDLEFLLAVKCLFPKKKAKKSWFSPKQERHWMVSCPCSEGL